MNFRIRPLVATAGMTVTLLASMLHVGTSCGAESNTSNPARSASQPAPTTTPPPQQPPTKPTPPMPEKVRADPAYREQLEQSAVKRKMLLEEASVRADDLLKRARAMREELAKDNPRKSYTELADQFVRVAVDMQAIVAQVRTVCDDPVFQDEQLQSSTNRMAAMDQFLNVTIRMLRETERLSTPISEIAGP